MKRVIAFLIGALMLISCLALPLSAAASGMTDITMNIEFNQTAARTMLDYINQFRTGGNAWYWNENNTQKIKVTKPALKYDYNLEKIAMQRAAEAAISFSHTRPNGEEWSTAFTDYGYLWINIGENLAAGNVSVYNAYLNMREDNDNYAGQSHRRNYLGDFDAIGIGQAELNGITYWALSFGTNGSGNTGVYNAPLDGFKRLDVEIQNSQIKTFKITVPTVEVEVEASQKTSIPDVTIIMETKESGVGPVSFTAALDWKSANENIVRIRNGAAEGVKAGETEIYADTPAGRVSMSVTVKQLHVHTYRHEITREPGCETYGIEKLVCTECGYFEYKEIPPNGHTYTRWVTELEAGCETAGSRYSYCDVCQTFHREEIPATGHSYGDWIPARTADCTHTGLEIRTCSTCQKTEERDIPAMGHKYVDIEIYEKATCVEEGYKKVHCERCGITEDIHYTVGNGSHDFTDWIVIREPTASAPGYREKTCTVCGEVVGEEIETTSDHEKTCPSKNMTDVIKTAWYHEAVDYAIENGLFSGMSKTTFAPNSPMTRAMLVTVLYRMENTPAPRTSNKFKDVKNGQWYTDAVTWAAENEIVAGMSATTFNPNGNITREQMAAIICRYTKFKGRDISKRADLSKYKDAGRISAWARDNLSWANAEGLITGTGVGLEPTGNATRAQVASILMRYCQKYE